MANTPLMDLQILNVGNGGDSELTLWNKIITNFSTIDSHTHTAGDGVAISVAALNIDSDLPLNSFALTETKNIRFNNEFSDVSSTRSLYVKSNELVFRDGAGNVIPITAGGSVNAGTGSITGLVAPASLTYSSVLGTFQFYKDSNVYAELESSNISLSQLNGDPNKYVTLAAPAISTSYTITFPASAPAANDYILAATTAGVTSWKPALFRGSISNQQIPYFNSSTNSANGITIENNEILLGNGGVPASGQLTNAYVAAAAAIAGTKISPNFGSQAVVTTGNISGAAITGSSLVTAESLSVTNTATFNGPVNVADSNETFTVAPAATFNSAVTVDSSVTATGSFSSAGSTFSATPSSSAIITAPTISIGTEDVGVLNLRAFDINIGSGNAAGTIDLSADEIKFSTQSIAQELSPKFNSINLGNSSRRWSIVFAFAGDFKSGISSFDNNKLIKIQRDSVTISSGGEVTITAASLNGSTIVGFNATNPNIFSGISRDVINDLLYSYIKIAVPSASGDFVTYSTQPDGGSIKIFNNTPFSATVEYVVFYE